MSAGVGLVLSGGGAKGAYQVGVVRALVEAGTRIDAVSGASIGALNAAILASAPSLKEGLAALETLWNELAHAPPLAPNYPAWLRLAAAAGLTLGGGAFAGMLARLGGARALFTGFDGLLSDDPLHRHMDRFLSVDALRGGLPLYVSVYRSNGALRDIGRAALAALGGPDTAASEFLHVQALSTAEQKEVLLASAALPLLYATRTVDGRAFVDGGIGGWQRSQGNTPITPLLAAGYGTVIVTHLSDGSLWSRHDHPAATVLEIRPQSPLQRTGGASDLLGFDATRIPSWIEQGYADTVACLDRVMNAQAARTSLAHAEVAAARSGDVLEAGDQAVAAALSRLRR